LRRGGFLVISCRHSLIAQFGIMRVCLFFLTLLALSACTVSGARSGRKPTGQLKDDASEEAESSGGEESSEEASSVSTSSEDDEEEYVDGEDRKRPRGVKGLVNRRSSGRNVRLCEEAETEAFASVDTLVHPSPRTT
jgi:hypothetical protein